MSWSHVGTADYAAKTSGQTSFTWTAAQQIGDIRLFVVHVMKASTQLSSVTGGGCAAWGRVSQEVCTASNASNGTNSGIEIWHGVATDTTTTTLTLGYSTSIGSSSVRLYRDDFRLLPAPGWDVGQSLNQINTAAHNFFDTSSSATTITWPATTATDMGPQLAFGYAFSGTTPSVGSSPGYTYSIDANGNLHIYNLDVIDSSTESPTASQTSGGGYSAYMSIFRVMSMVSPQTKIYKNPVQRAALL